VDVVSSVGLCGGVMGSSGSGKLTPRPAWKKNCTLELINSSKLKICLHSYPIHVRHLRRRFRFRTHFPIPTRQIRRLHEIELNKMMIIMMKLIYIRNACTYRYQATRHRFHCRHSLND
jgi:hypothetical protein